MNNITNTKLREHILNETQQGLNVFLMHFPTFWMKYRYGQYIKLDSPFHSEKGTLSIFHNDEKGKWFYKDHIKNGESYGDVFNFIARLHKIDVVRDFRRVATIIKETIKDYTPPNFNTYKLINRNTGEYVEFYKE